MDALCHFDAVFNKQTGIKQSCLVSYKLRAFLSLIRKLRLCEIFKIFIAVKIYSIPELGSPLVEIID